VTGRAVPGLLGAKPRTPRAARSDPRGACNQFRRNQVYRNVRQPREEDSELGFPVPEFTPPNRPGRDAMRGVHCHVEPLDVERHGADLHKAYTAPGGDRGWVYLPYGPFSSEKEFIGWLESACSGSDPLFHAVVDAKTRRASGLASYLRINPDAGSIEVGHIHFSPSLQRTPAATEAMYLMMRRVFELGYRRYEWKCNALNQASRRAATRLGFSYEGIFRQATVVKGRNRDTAWYACIDLEWPRLKAAFEQWLSPGNFDADGRQRLSLGTLTGPILVSTG
jgi:RimJ/RimL family protein N-acetyltransferase